jgi:fructokinase
MHTYIRRLAKSLATVVNVLDPDAIVLGGGLSNIDALYSRVPDEWTNWIFSDRVDTRLVRHMHGDSSGVRGAAWLWPESMTPASARAQSRASYGEVSPEPLRGEGGNVE